VADFVSVVTESFVEHFAESCGLLLQDEGLPPMAGRVLGWLLVCTPEQQSAADLQRGLKASAGSVNGSIHLLQRAKLIERVAIPGDRTAYFRCGSNAWVQTLRSRLDVLGKFRALMEGALAGLEPGDESQAARLTNASEFYRFLGDRLAEGLTAWEQKAGS
jgi:hypothetical protein